MPGSAGPKRWSVKRLPVIQTETSRRAFLTSTALGALAIVPLAALACSKKLVCTDVSKLKADEQQARSAVGYKEPTPEPAKRCDNCAAYTPAAADQCGACADVKGPIHPAGFCNIWRQKG